MQHYKNSFILCIFLLASCKNTPTYEYLDTHPDFSPLVPMQGKTEYQVVWYRSWQPLIHLRIRVESNELTDAPHLEISYAISEDYVQSLKTVEKPLSKLKKFSSILESTGFWDDDLVCLEQSYREGRDYLQSVNGCEWITMSDGASMSIAASENSRSKAISYLCGSIESCKPYDTFAVAILKELGLEEEF